LSQLTEAGKGVAKMFDFVDKTFNQMPFTIQPFIVIPFRLGSLMGWNDNFDAVFSQPIDKFLRSIAPICNQPLKVKAIHQNQRLDDVVSLSGTQAQAQGIAQTIDGNMDFSAEATPTPTQRLIRRVVTFFVRLPRTDERGQWCYPSSHFPNRDRRQNEPAFAPTRLVHTSDQSVYKRYSIFRTQPVANAIVNHFGSPFHCFNKITAAFLVCYISVRVFW
jgi:hypothetical protein